MALDGRIYAIGGDNGSFLGLVEEYDPVLDTWTTKAPMRMARGYLAAAALNGKIYAVGGYNGSYPDPSAYLNVVEEYDPITNSWSYKAPMLLPKANHTVCAVNGKIYATSGVNNYQPSSGVEEYDPNSDFWQSKGVGPGSAYNQGAAVVNDRIYVMGGIYGYTAEYDPAANVWRAKEPMPSERSALSAAAVGGKIYAIGGQSGNAPIATVEQFDPGRLLFVHRKN